MHATSLCSLLQNKHGTPHITYQRSTRNPINCIFGSPSLEISKGDCLSFGRLVGDHRALRMVIPIYLIYGFDPPTPSHPNSRRLKMKDPCVVDIYLDILHEECLKEDLYTRMNYIHVNMTTPLSPNLQSYYEEVVDILVSKMQLAEFKCRKIHTSRVPWFYVYKKPT